MQNRIEKQQDSHRLLGRLRRVCAFALSLVLLFGVLPTPSAAAVTVNVSDGDLLRSTIEGTDEKELLLSVSRKLSLENPIVVPSGHKVELRMNANTIDAYNAIDGEAVFTVSENAELYISSYGGRAASSLINAPRTFIRVKKGGVLRIGTGVTVSNGYNTGMGGCVYIENGGEAILGVKGASGSYNERTVIGGYAGIGGGVYVESGGRLTFSDADTEFTYCEAAEAGGAVYVANGGIVTGGKGNITFDACSAKQGGGVYLEDGAGMTFGSGKTVFTGCSAVDGGGFYVTKGAAVTSGSGTVGLKTCTATRGGGIYAQRNAGFTFGNGGFGITGCEASGSGGGIYFGAGAFSLGGDGLTLSGCTAAENGGGIYAANGASLTVNAKNAAITECTAAQGGGMFFENGSSLQNDAGSFSVSKCTASESGGGLYFENGDALCLDNGKLSVSENSADRGGGVFVNAGTLMISSVRNNRAAQGGGFYLAGTLDLPTKAVISGNTADQGGAVYIANGGKLGMSSVESDARDRSLIGNSATGNGGALYIAFGGRASLANIVATQNAATHHGGLAYVESPAEKELSAVLKFNHFCEVTGNLAGGKSEDVCLTTETMGQIGAKDLMSDTLIYVTLPNNSTSKAVIRSLEYTEYFVIGGKAGGDGAGWFGETEDEDETGHVSHNGDVSDFATMKATLEAGISVRLLNNITATQPITLLAVKDELLTIDLNGFVLSGSDELTDRMFTVGKGVRVQLITRENATADYRNAPGGFFRLMNGAELTAASALEFSDCRAQRGGAILIESGASLHAASALSFTNCKAIEDGGAVCVDSGTLEANSALTFTDCEAVNGGALYIEKSGRVSGGFSLLCTDCKASQFGGALYSAAKSLKPDRIECTNGTAKQGGGIYLAPDSELNAVSYVIADNTASGNGGGIYAADKSKVWLVTGSLRNNTAMCGGGVYLESGADVALENGENDNKIQGNKAMHNGGAFYISIDAAATVRNARITGNSAGIHGGAFYLAGESDKKSGTLRINSFTADTLREMSANTARGMAEDIFLAGFASDQVRVSGSIWDGVTVHVTGHAAAEERFLKDRKWKESFIFTEASDYYLLRVETGEVPGSNVLYFGIRYIDHDGIERTQFLYPQEASLSEGYDLAGGLEAVNNRVDLVRQITGYTLNGHSDGFSIDSAQKGLRAFSTDYYVFEPLHALSQVVRIDVFMACDPDKRGTSEKQAWTCCGMYFYHVDDFYGTDMAGYYSDQIFISFGGQILAKMKPQGGDESVVVDFSIASTDEIFRVSETPGYRWQLDIPDTPEPYNSATLDYLFDFEFADKFGAGIEALASTYNGGNRLTDVIEALSLKIEYRDYDNRTRTVTIPLVVSALSWAVENGFADPGLPVIGAAQQGEELIFSGAFPDAKEVTAYTLIFGEKAESAAKLMHTAPTAGQKARIENLKKETDTCSLLGVRLYDAETRVNVSPSAASLGMTVDASAQPILYYTAENLYGKTLMNGNTSLFLAPYTGGTGALRPSDSSGGYLITITTDTMDEAATANEITLNLHYVAQNGEMSTIADISLAEQAREEYGFWPGKNGNAAYQAAMYPGQRFTFALDAADVSYFTGATLTIKPDSGGNVDAWQMREFRITKFTSVSKRSAEWKDIGFSDRLFTRSYTTSKVPVILYPNALDLQAEDGENAEELGKVFLSKSVPSVTITFGQESRGSTMETETELDWNRLRYSMSYDETHQDLKFGSTMCTYTVKVNVASNSGVQTENGDAGSNNLFYFMLCFENGTSGYVLANLQLGSDGFRAGMTETFTVKTNRDYGLLTAVYIIPDDSNEDTRFDKLNIKEIMVVQNSTAGIAKTWKISNVGWIGVDYYDKGAESTMSGRPGRSETDLARIFYVNESGYSVNLLFAMKTGSYTLDGEEWTRPKGSIMAEITYNNGNRNVTESVDVIEKMYEYIGAVPDYYIVDNTKYARITDDMLRANKTDRFIVSLPNMRSITEVKLFLRTEETTRWRMEHLDIYRVDSDGLLQYNINGELQRSNKVTLLCENSGTGSTVEAHASDGSKVFGDPAPLTILATKNNVEVDMTASTWTSTITREPVGRNDTLNVYVHMTEPVSTGDYANYQMNTTVWWNHPVEGPIQTELGQMELSPNRNVFYALDVDVGGFTGLDKIKVKSNYKSDNVVYGIDRVVVEHIRSGVKLMTYTFNLNGNDAREAVVRDAEGASSASITGEKQKVRLFFSENIQKQTVDPEKDDILLAIRYHSVNDLLRGDGGSAAVYNSKYIYLSDLKVAAKDENGKDIEKLKYPRITPGMIAEFEFRESDVADIIGISVAAVGRIEATLDSACVLCSAASGDESEQMWFSFADETRLTDAPYVMTPSREETVMPVRMKLTTGKGLVDTGISSSVSADVPIRMTVYYLNSLTNALDKMTIENLNHYVTEGGFQNDGTAIVEFAVRNSSSIRYIELEPRSAYSVGAAWELKTVECTREVGGIKVADRSKTVNRDILQGHPERIDLATVTVSVDTMVLSETGGNPRTQATDSTMEKKLEITLKPGRSVTLFPSVQGTLPGYGFTLSAMEGTSMNADAPVDTFEESEDGAQIMFTPPEAGKTYVVRVASEEMPDCYCDILVTVEPETQQPATKPGTEPGTGTGTGTGTEPTTEPGTGTGTEPTTEPTVNEPAPEPQPTTPTQEP